MAPEERPTATQLLEHPFFRKAGKKEKLEKEEFFYILIMTSSAATSDMAPYAAKADKEVDRSYLDEVEHPH
jgi:hypothetical protein